MLELHALPLPIPITLMGEQVKPMRPVKSPSTMPRRPARIPASAEVLETVESQHWTLPELHDDAGALFGTGVATARRGRASREMAESFMLSMRETGEL